MSTKQINSRIQIKSDTSNNWHLASIAEKPFIPLKGEFINYTNDPQGRKLKLGDGIHTPDQLDWIDDIQIQADWGQNVPHASDYIKNRTHYISSYGTAFNASLGYDMETGNWVEELNQTLSISLLPNTEYEFLDAYSLNMNILTTDDQGNIESVIVEQCSIKYQGSEVAVYDVILSIINNKSTVKIKITKNDDSVSDNYIKRQIIVHVELYGLYIQLLDAKYLPIDKETITINSDGKLKANQIQDDWNQNDSSAVDYIKNRTHYQSEDYLVRGVNVGYEDNDDGYTTGNICGPVILPHPLIPNTPYVLTLYYDKALEDDDDRFTLTVDENYKLSVNSTPTDDNTFHAMYIQQLGGEAILNCELDKNELIFTPYVTGTVDIGYLVRWIDLYGLKTTPLNTRYIQIGLHQGGGENSIVQNDGLNDGSDDYAVDTSSNYTNATHAVVFGNNNRIIKRNDAQDGKNSFIAGGLGHTIYSGNSFIGGGDYNTVGSTTKTSSRSGIIGGMEQVIDAYHAFIGGGRNNTINDNYSGIVGGHTNTIDSTHSFAGGGENNNVSGDRSATIGGSSNNVSGVSSATIGGALNIVSNNFGAVAGGYQDTVAGYCSYIGGGLQNKIESSYGFIGGGRGNTVDGPYSAVFNHSNAVSSQYGFGTGSGNQLLDGNYGFITGGNNIARGTGVFVTGYANNIHCRRAAIFGHHNSVGSSNDALNAISDVFMAGTYLKSNSDGQALFGAYNTPDPDSVVIIGGGSSDTKRKNIYTLRAGGTPTADTDLTTKQYVDGKIADLSGALHYIGTTTTPIAEGTTTNEIIISGTSYIVKAGDVVTYDDSDYGLIEFVWNGTQWIELGAASSFVTKAVYDAKIAEFERRIKALEDILANVETLTITESDNTLTVQ